MIDYSNLPFRVEPMTSQDVATVMEIEIVAFSAPWSARAYEYELHYNENAHYYVVRMADNAIASAPVERQTLLRRLFGHAKLQPAINAPAKPLLGYAGFWIMVDEAHISTIASHPDWRRHGIGELLLLAMIDGAAEVGARDATLEVRVSNAGAQALYRKYGFDVAGMRKHYYSDNNEDALIMTTPLITTMEYQLKIQELKDLLFNRLSR
jgi:ribosomal-protein-alanine N-acetyltransferase